MIVLICCIHRRRDVFGSIGHDFSCMPLYGSQHHGDIEHWSLDKYIACVPRPPAKWLSAMVPMAKSGARDIHRPAGHTLNITSHLAAEISADHRTRLANTQSRHTRRSVQSWA